MANTAYQSTYTGAQIDAAIGTVGSKADKITVTDHGTSSTTFTLTPNVYHKWGAVASLSLSLSSVSASTLDEFMFEFTCPSGSATTLTLPASVSWIETPTFEAGKTYQISILNNLAGYLTAE